MKQVRRLLKKKKTHFVECYQICPPILLFSHVRLLVFQNSHLFFSSVLYFHLFLRKFPTYTFIQNCRLFGTLCNTQVVMYYVAYTLRSNRPRQNLLRCKSLWDLGSLQSQIGSLERCHIEG